MLSEILFIIFLHVYNICIFYRTKVEFYIFTGHGRILTLIVLILCCLSMKIASNAFIRVFVITNKELFYISNDNKKIYLYIRGGNYCSKFYGGLYYSDIIDMKYFWEYIK